MSERPSPGDPRWLNAEEMEAWLGLLHLLVELPQALDRQLRTEAGLGHVYYAILATLSARPERTCSLSELARFTGTSLSRLSHALDALAARGLVARCETPGSTRLQVRLSDAGMALLVEVAPGHVAEVRRLIFDRLTPDEVRALALLTDKLALRPRAEWDPDASHSSAGAGSEPPPGAAPGGPPVR